MAPNSTRARPAKPAKPYSDFPLFPHATRRWAKKIRGRTHYFGPWDNPDAALRKYLDQRDDLYAGREPRAGGDGITIRDVVNHFLTAKQRKLETGELQPKTFADYHACAGRLVAAFGASRPVDDLIADDFGVLRAQLAETRGPTALGNEIQRIRTIFKYGYDAGIMEKAMRFGPEFVKPSQKVIRQARHAKGARMFEPDQIRSIMKAASPSMKAMVLLGANAAYGNTDLSKLPQTVLDLRMGVIDFPRPKTSIERRATIWSETVKALREAISVRPNPKNKDDAGLVFLTTRGLRFVRTNEKGTTTDTVCKEFGGLLDELKIKRPGLSFYALRHTFRTVADETHDYPAIDRIMGHEDASTMATRYRERIDDDRLRRVTDHVREWLFGAGGAERK